MMTNQYMIMEIAKMRLSWHPWPDMLFINGRHPVLKKLYDNDIFGWYGMVYLFFHFVLELNLDI